MPLIRALGRQRRSKSLNFEASLKYRVNSRAARITQRNPDSKKTKQNKAQRCIYCICAPPATEPAGCACRCGRALGPFPWNWTCESPHRLAGPFSLLSSPPPSLPLPLALLFHFSPLSPFLPLSPAGITAFAPADPTDQQWLPSLLSRPVHLSRTLCSAGRVPAGRVLAAAARPPQPGWLKPVQPSKARMGLILPPGCQPRRPSRTRPSRVLPHACGPREQPRRPSLGFPITLGLPHPPGSPWLTRHRATPRSMSPRASDARRQRFVLHLRTEASDPQGSRTRGWCSGRTPVLGLGFPAVVAPTH